MTEMHARQQQRTSQFLAVFLLCGLTLPSLSSQAFDLVEALPLTERIVMIHVKEGHVVHHQKGQQRSDGEKVILTQLDTAKASRTDAWTVSSSDDPAFKEALHPEKIGRKSKGTDFAWMVQGWDPAKNCALNKDPDHAKDHWLYLVLPRTMVSGKTYSVLANGITGIEPLSLTYSVEKSRSEAVHVNLMGYPADSPAKFAYVYHWAGDMGSVDLTALKGKPFRLIDQDSGAAAYSGTVTFRAPANRQETGQIKETPNGSFLCAEVWECDFSTFQTPGNYVVAVDGVGCSFPFKINADAYREAFRVTCRGLYHNRSGIALKKPYTEFERPAPHNPLLTPGFAGKLFYTTSRSTDWKGEGDPADKSKIESAIKGPIDVWGWYQDAGDWDSYDSHTTVASTLCFAFETAPDNFSDGELNIPESGNGLPDILDEAAWLPRFCFRLRHALVAKQWGTGGIGLRVCGDHFGGDTRKDGSTKASYEDVDRQWVVSGEDPVSTFRYAAVAAHLAWCMKLVKHADPENVDWRVEAEEAYAWALSHTQPGDERGVKPNRCHAAAQLFRLTGDEKYEAQFEKDISGFKVGETIPGDHAFGPWAYALGDKGKPDLKKQVREWVLASCETIALKTSEKRALRWGGEFNMPMLVGQQTTPWILEGIVGYTLTKELDPAKAKAYRGSVVTTCDYFLGTNALNQTWVTGLGVRHVQGVFHMDAWYNGKPTLHPGLIPYGPWRKQKEYGQGPWDSDWANKTVYPGIDQWPGNERWFDNRNCPLSAEFTIHQNTCYAAATFGWLCAPGKSK